MYQMRKKRRAVETDPDKLQTLHCRKGEVSGAVRSVRGQELREGGVTKGVSGQ